MNKDICALSW